MQQATPLVFDTTNGRSGIGNTSAFARMVSGQAPGQGPPGGGQQGLGKVQAS
jgi:hypothetical protein